MGHSVKDAIKDHLSECAKEEMAQRLRDIKPESNYSATEIMRIDLFIEPYAG